MPSPISQPRRKAAPADKPLRADAKRNRDLLLAAAEAVFTEHGADASLEEIARRAGVGIGTLYRHFPTRDDLLAQVIDDSNAAIVARAEELLAAPSPLLALTRWLEALIGQTATFRGLTQALAANYPTTPREPCSRLSTACVALTAAGAALVVRAQQAGEIRDDVDPADVVISANAAAWIAEQTGDAGAAARHLALVLDGLRTQRPAKKR
ncbi:MAG TPA: helix-turn-helix domain-containing protein [Kofleriaceae bacterium]